MGTVMAETNTNSTVSISLMLMKANLEHKVPVANARIAIKLCRVTYLPTLPADRALACAIRLTNLNNGRSYERDYVLSYSPLDQAYHRIITKEAPCFNKGRNSCNDLGR